MKVANTLDTFAKKLGDLIPEWLYALVARAAIFMIFWPAAQTKLAGASAFGQKWMFWEVSSSTIMLFDYEYSLPIIPGPIAAYLATWIEFFGSIFLLFGLFTRACALIFLTMTLIIQIFVYPGAWASHILWASALLYLLKNGAANISLDALIRK